MILSGENMIKTVNMLLESLSQYGNPNSKLSRLKKRGEVFPIIRGLYETDRDTPGYLLAGSIYGPSYLSFDFALAYYGMIPEAVYAFTSATFEKKKNKCYKTMFGSFYYRDVPSLAFPFFIRLVKEGDYYFRIADREKALCDKLYILPPVKNVHELEVLIFDDLRVDKDEFMTLDLEKVAYLSNKYGSTNIKKLSTLLRRKQNAE